MRLCLWHSMLHKPEGLCSAQSCWTMTAVSGISKELCRLRLPRFVRGLCPHSIARQLQQPSFCVLNHPHLTWWTDRLINVCDIETLNLQKPWVTVAMLLTSLNGRFPLCWSHVERHRELREGNEMRSECHEMVQQTQYGLSAVHYDHFIQTGHGEPEASITGKYSAWNVLTDGASIWKDGNV